MSSFLTVIHIIICFMLIIAVLLQSGKSADLAGAFGGAGSQTVFGPRGAANFLTKITTISAVLFMITSMGLWFLSSGRTASVVKGEEVQQTEKAATATEQEKKVPEKKAPPIEQKKEKEQKGKEKEKK
ncbi:MAG: preprotein translocase subunit SecG [Candidatus Aminicenantes bacterium]|nr:preprotein translocase subunit SecG [Candidatus Aminicenantes bacterium]